MRVVAMIVVVVVASSMHEASCTKLRLGKLRDKVTKVLNSAGETLRDAFKRSLSEQQAQQGSITDQVMTAAVIEGLDQSIKRSTGTKDECFNAIKKQQKKLYWVHQNDFLTKLKAAHAVSKEDARKVIQEQLAKKPADSRSPFFAFAAELEEEGKIIRDGQTELLRLRTRNNKEEKKERVSSEQIAAEITLTAQLKTRLVELIDIVEDALFSV